MRRPAGSAIRTINPLRRACAHSTQAEEGGEGRGEDPMQLPPTSFADIFKSR